eukprot:CAMPEP_0183354512 /NCGR_PEP_ID=MMETSP0164_2-20130417/37356_1 /TAXON_ID=221442 /ORGANISM="Coccolithus pelagicus ssp braarudi, Strain PLY182g" /LENGTH=201 /DNA_ID=CAMNT_0025527409 /DNA_START=44 /DNA_END=649 /DNA_ORIENTATION=-
MDSQIFNLKFTSKQIARTATKCTKQEKDELIKVKKAMEKGDMDTARIYGQNAIRIRNTGNNYLRLASRIDAVASRLESAIKMQQVSSQMGTVVKGMDKALASMDMDKIASVMEQFEKSFDELDLRGQAVEGTLASSTATSMPESEVDSLIQQVSDEHGLEFASRAVDAATAPVAMKVTNTETATQEADEDQLEKRLAALRG